MLIRVLWVMLFSVGAVRCRAIGRPIEAASNEVDHGSSADYKNASGLSRKIGRKSTLSTDGDQHIVHRQIEPVNLATDVMVLRPTGDTLLMSNEGNVTSKNPILSWILTPLTNRIQFSPQAFFKDRLDDIKETLNNLGVNLQQNRTERQFPGINGLLQLSGLNDSGFYTNRLDSAGFLGGNGWFANKGGILGGPGAILSTGSVLTDYPSSYRK